MSQTLISPPSTPTALFSPSQDGYLDTDREVVFAFFFLDLFLFFQKPNHPTDLQPTNTFHSTGSVTASDAASPLMYNISRTERDKRASAIQQRHTERDNKGFIHTISVIIISFSNSSSSNSSQSSGGSIAGIQQLSQVDLEFFLDVTVRVN